MAIEEKELNEMPVSDRLNTTTLVLANAAELANMVIRRIDGNDFTTSVDGLAPNKEMVLVSVHRDIIRDARASAGL
jgi:hypothetical protein